jgi:hypothetical protein
MTESWHLIPDAESKPWRDHMVQRIAMAVLFALALVTGLACSSTQATSKQLERVAKDWALTIRASQVVPVYPLTEDVQPGDVFLVQTPIEDEVAVYKAKGFLPLDSHLARLFPYNYAKFYNASFAVDGNTVIPRDWRFASTQAAGRPASTQPTNWAVAPRAAFPSYSFTVTASGGLNLAIPVSGVPIGMSLMGSRNAHGNITIADSYTYGIDESSLLAQTTEWAAKNAAMLKEMGPRYVQVKTSGDTRPAFGRQFNYVRIVSRVYLTGSVNISLSNDEASGGFLSARPPAPLELLNPTGSASNYESVISALNNSIGKASTQPSTTQPTDTPVIGGSVKVATASNRSITLNEVFPRPLVVGYLGFDRRIEIDGKLGPLVPTQAKLNGFVQSPIAAHPDNNSSLIEGWLGAVSGHPIDPSTRATHRSQLISYLTAHSIDVDPSDIINSAQYVSLRGSIVSYFQIR